MKKRATVSVLTALAYVVALCLGAPTAGADTAKGLDSYLAAGWTTILQTPSAQNPYGTGGLAFACLNLGGTVAPWTPERTGVPECTVEPGTKIFIQNSVECSTFEGIGPTDKELRKCTRDNRPHPSPIGNPPLLKPTVTLDGKSVPVHLVETPLQNIVLPEGNIFEGPPFNQPPGTQGSFVARGWVTLLDPLTPGTHTIVINTEGNPTITTTIVVHGQ